jgi:hypothetical protein
LEGRESQDTLKLEDHTDIESAIDSILNNHLDNRPLRYEKLQEKINILKNSEEG